MKRTICASGAKFDTSTTHMSYYDNFLNEEDLKYMQSAKNLTGQIVQMTPKEYFNECAKVFNSTPERLIEERGRDKSLMREYTKAMKNGDVFPLCFINYARNTQEGLHRMLAAANAFGWDKEYPVLLITIHDQVREARREFLLKMNDFERYDFPKAVDAAVSELSDWNSPCPDNICELINETTKQKVKEMYDEDVEVESEIEERDGAHKLCVYLASFEGFEIQMYSDSSDHWIEDMFDEGDYDGNSDDTSSTSALSDDLNDIDDLIDIDDLFFK